MTAAFGKEEEEGRIICYLFLEAKDLGKLRGSANEGISSSQRASKNEKCRGDFRAPWKRQVIRYLGDANAEGRGLGGGWSPDSGTSRAQRTLGTLASDWRPG